jgi:peptidoglycan hydrolase-like protein with peptidoglycan-binding domain
LNLVTTGGGTRLPDGIFGPETASVVRNFQTQHRLSADGIVGRQTLQKLEELITTMIAIEKAKFVATSNMPPGMSNSHHSTLQRG